MNQSFLNRRAFLASACAGGLATSFAPSISFAQSATDQRFVFVLLRGAMDGLHAVVPYGDPAYASARGQLAYDRSVLTPLDSTFALAPGLSPLAPAFLEGELLPVQGLAIPYRTRSHFDAQSILETGLDKPVGTATGWMHVVQGLHQADVGSPFSPLPLQEGTLQTTLAFYYYMVTAYLVSSHMDSDRSEVAW